MGIVAVKSAMAVFGHVVNDVLSFVVFTALDLLDVFLCFVFKLADYAFEDEWKPCYCSSSPRDMITSSGKIFVSENGGSTKVLSMISSTKIQLEDISDTLYSRPSFVADVSRATINELRRLKKLSRASPAAAVTTSHRRSAAKAPSGGATTYTINSAIIQMLQDKIGGHKSSHRRRSWSDCDCKGCNPSSSDTLFVHVEDPKDGKAAEEDVLFIHGFISSSSFWTETVFPNFSEVARSRYRLFAVDLLGYGKSPKPADSLYTLREHVDMIERSVLEPYKVKSFHIVAHSLGSILALALAVKYRDAVKSMTILAPPYFPVPDGEQGTQYVLRRVAPRRVWPLMALGSSVLCWYEHITRTLSVVLCKNHIFWKNAVEFVTRKRVRTYLMDGFFCHTHHASWHTLHNVICGSAGKIDGYLDVVRDELRCAVAIFHGRDDELLPVECSYALKARIPQASLKVVDHADHITIVVARHKAFARDLEDIWNNARRRHNIAKL